MTAVPQSNVPFFSVVIPTRNRAALLHDAVDSILNQSFGDFEIVISDNSDEANRTRNRDALREALADRRVRYVKPPHEMSMVDHWEWAATQARGQYVGYVTDRMGLRFHALEALHAALAPSLPELISYGSQKIMERPGDLQLNVDRSTAPCRTLQSKDVLAGFAKGKFDKDTPRMLNSFVRRDVLDGIRALPGGAFGGISPDYSFLFRSLSIVDSYLHVPQRLLVAQGEAESNGRAFKTGKANSESRDFIQKLSPAQRDYLKLGPVKDDIFIVPNGILREYEIVAAMNNDGRFLPVDAAAFYRNTAKRLVKLGRIGQLNPLALDNLEAFAREKGFSLKELAPARHPSAITTGALAARSAGARLVTEATSRLVPQSLQNTLFRAGLTRKVRGRTLHDVLSADAARR